MKLESDIELAGAELVKSLLEEVGIGDVIVEQPSNARGAPDFVVRWYVGGQRQELAVDVRARYSEAWLDSIQRAVERPFMIVAPRLGPQARKVLRAKKVNHADFGGLAYLRLPGVLVDRERAVRAKQVRWTPSSREANPFSKRASRVLRTLFANPDQTLKITELASRTGLAVGWASAVAEAIVNRGYAQHFQDGVKLMDPASALVDWTREYGWRRNEQRIYRVPLQREEIIERMRLACEQSESSWGLTLLAAAERRVGYVRDEGPVHVYFSPKSELVEEAVLERLYAEESRGGGELVLLEPYYGPSTYIASEDEAGVKAVSDLQLFLDLVDYPVRGLEVAEVLLRSRMAKPLQLGARDIHRVMEAVG